MMVQQIFFFRTNGTTKIDLWISTSLICKISCGRNSIVSNKKRKKKKEKKKAFQNTN